VLFVFVLISYLTMKQEIELVDIVTLREN